MSHLDKLAKIGSTSWGNHGYLVVETMNQFWMMISCSQISGQMSFKDYTKYVSHRVHNKPHCLEKKDEFGVTNDGRILPIRCRISQKLMLEKMKRTAELLKMKNFDKGFLTIRNTLPLFSEGNIGLECRENGSSAVTFYPVEERKCYQLILDPLCLSHGGELLTPMTVVMERIEEHFAKFADPFATKLFGRKESQKTEAKVIAPCLRQQVRKRKVGKRKKKEKQ